MKRASTASVSLLTPVCKTVIVNSAQAASTDNVLKGLSVVIRATVRQASFAMLAVACGGNVQVTLNVLWDSFVMRRFVNLWIAV